MAGWSPSEPRAVYGFTAGLVILLYVIMYIRMFCMGCSLFMFSLAVTLQSKLGYVGKELAQPIITQ